jgi:hypothetical protein
MNLPRVLRVMCTIASRVIRALTRIAKQWSGPGSGPKLITG